MSDLVEFLRAQMDEDERVAQAAVDEVGIDEWDAVGDRGEDEIAIRMWTVVRVARPLHYYGDQRAVMRHIAAWDPARVLAEVAAKRAIIDLHRPWFDSGDCSSCGDVPQAAFPCETILALAQPYADRPGWDEAWRQT